MDEKKIRGIIELLPMAYAYHKVVFDNQGNPEDYIFLNANKAFEEITGLTTEKLIGKKVTEVLLDIKNDQFDCIGFYGRVAMTGETKQVMQYTEALDKWYNITAASPEKGYLVATFQDVTVQIQRDSLFTRQQDEIGKIHKDLEIIFNSTQDAMSLVECVEEGFHYIRNNVVHQIRSGFNAQDIRGKTPEDIFGMDGKFVLEKYRKCRDSSQTVTYEHVFHFASGDRVWLTSITPVIQNGAVKLLVTSSKDITELKKLQREHEETLQRLQSMFSKHMAVMLIIEPETGQILEANPSACEFYGYTKEEILQLKINEINMLSKDEIKRLCAAALEKDKRYFVFPHRLKSGEIKKVDVYSSPISYGEKTVLYSIIFDITDREKLREELYQEKERLRITLESIGDGVVTTDTNGFITSMNQSAEDITGWTEEQAKKQPFSDIFNLCNEQTGQQIESPVARVLETGSIVSLENHTLLVNKSGMYIPIADSASPIRHQNGDVLGVVMVFRDISRDKRLQEQILYLSYNDALTGLYNRRFLEEEMKRLEAEIYQPLAVIMGDVNGLKLANDVFGHEQGDHLLRTIARILKENCRDTDVIGRWGGDEFLIFLPQTKSETARQIMKNIKKSCEDNSEGVVQISIGMGCAVKKQREKLESVIQEAEERMYHQKLIEGRILKNYMTNILIGTLYDKKLEDKEHMQKLTHYCELMGKRLQLSEAEILELKLLAEVHNIGLLGINQELLYKKEKLNPEEWEDIKRHAEIGYRIAQYTTKYSTVAESVLSIHEHWDGSGYPRGIKEKNIPYLSRVFSIVDAYDAMIHERAYRRAKSKEAAKQELRRNAGSQFDPTLVEVFLHIDI